jgi:DNA-binding response OmpR family regulator
MARVLIVEDEKALNDAYALVLRREGHEVEVAFNGEEGLRAFQKNRPELILLDLRMPKMNGVEFLKQLNPAKNYPEVRVIVFSNYDDPQEIKDSKKYGATRYILKAWSSPRELVKVVKETLDMGQNHKVTSPKSSSPKSR